MVRNHKAYHKTVLPNGIRVIGESVEGYNSCTVGVFVFCGGRDELPSQTGIAHFTEHMLFKGTEKRTALDISKCIDNIGGILNAYTNKEYTCYYSKIISDKLEVGVELLSDIFLNSVFPEEELKKEKEVVVQEIHMIDDTPDELVIDLLMEAIYGKESLGASLLGTEQHVKSFSKENIVTFIDNLYLNDRVIIACAGNFNWNSFLKLTEKYFGERVKKTGRFPVRHSLLRKENILVKKDQLNQVHVAIGFPTVSIYEKDKYPLKLLNFILGVGMSSLLFQELREKHGYVYSTYSSTVHYQDTGFLYIYYATTPDKKELCEEKIGAIIDKLNKGNISDEDIMHAKEQIKGYTLISLDSSDARFSYNAKSELYFNSFVPVEEELEKLSLVAKDDIINVAQKYINLEKASTALVLPA